jgi:protein-arginine kinase activator protein McsA
MITIECRRKKSCGWITDIEETSETNPNICPNCGGGLKNAYTGEDYPEETPEETPE